MKSWRVVLGSVLLLLVCPLSRAGTLAQFHTVFGDIEVELYDQDKPVTVRNFIRYVQSGAYQNEFAHRLEPGFVLQGGGFTITNRGTTNATIVSVPAYPPITNEFDVGTRYSNVYGTIAMAKLGGDTNSATSEWFFNLANNTFLDAPDTNNLFVVFGQVIHGTNVLNIFNQFQYWDGTQSSNLVYNWGAPFDNLPLLHPSLVETSFVFVDISLLQIDIKPAPGGGRLLSWNSATGLTNIIEFTTNLPPVWHTLLQTNGTGAQMSVLDPAATPRRFYRARVTP
jgi:cyclophilin family peptidyl-prolyl cis-trans isomerase